MHCGGDVVDRINLVAGFAAAVLDGNYTAPALNGLDYVTAASVKTTTYTVRADLQAAVDWLNSSSEGYVTATRVAAVGAIPAVAAFAFLSGGSDGTTTNEPPCGPICASCSHPFSEHNAITGLGECYERIATGGICQCRGFRPSSPSAQEPT